MTPAEAILWRHLRGRRLASFKFRRQHPIGPFFVDLACPECKLILEVDGETHLGREQEDAGRTSYLQAHGWLVLRLWNTEVYDELDSVLEAIYMKCEARKPHPTSQPLGPVSGRGETALAPSPGGRGAGVRFVHPEAFPLTPAPLPRSGARGERGAGALAPSPLSTGRGSG